MRPPTLELDWELGVYLGLRALWRAVAPAPAPRHDEARVARLAALLPRLRPLARVLAGAPVEVLEARGAGGLRGDTLLLPEVMDLAEDPEANRGLYVLRVAVNATMHADGARPRGEDLADEVATLRAASAAIRRLGEELPRFGPAWAEAAALERARRPDPARLRGRAARLERWRQAALAGEALPDEAMMIKELRGLSNYGSASPDISLWGRLVRAELGGAGEAAGAPPPASAREVLAPLVEDLRLEALDLDRQRDLPVHVFEKVETLDGHTGTLRQLDGSDELDEHLEALEEVDLGTLIRGGPEVAAVLKAEVGLEARIPDVGEEVPGEAHVVYDEWDARRRAWLRGWCRVVPTPMPLGDPGLALETAARHRLLIDQVHRRLRHDLDARRARPRQLQGDELDLDAVVRAQVDLRVGHTPDPRLYRAPRPHARDVATLALVDLSLSTDSWVEDRRVLDVTREALVVLGELAARLGDPLRVMGFASHTRNRVRAFGIKDWDEPWAVGRQRLGLLKPQGYTRLGPALRHATAALAARPARRRVLLLLTDGKPTDLDRYEGQHGVADVHVAAEQARRQGILLHAFTVDSHAREALPAMMGPGGWTLLRHPQDLPEALSRLWARSHR